MVYQAGDDANKGTNKRWKDILTKTDCDVYEARAIKELRRREQGMAQRAMQQAEEVSELRQARAGQGQQT